MMRRMGIPVDTAADLLGHLVQMMLKVYRQLDGDKRLLAMVQPHADNDIDSIR